MIDPTIKPPPLRGALSTVRRPRGFAAMDPALQRDIARRGGIAAHERGTAHEFDAAQAQAAGRIGGQVVAQDRKRMAELGRLGGKATAARRAKRKAVAP